MSLYQYGDRVTIREAWHPEPRTGVVVGTPIGILIDGKRFPVVEVWEGPIEYYEKNPDACMLSLVAPEDLEHALILSASYEAMKTAFHEEFGGSFKHDRIDERFESGWRAAERYMTERYMTERQKYGECGVCGQPWERNASPTGTWLSHLTHPEDGHDATEKGRA